MSSTTFILNLLFGGLFATSSMLVVAQEGTSIGYDDPGFTVTDNKNFKATGTLFYQLRYMSDDSIPTNIAAFAAESESTAGTNRARAKIKGYLGAPWIKFSIQHELRANYLMDFTLAFEKYDWLKLKLGQWKVDYSRERSISSGAQQMLDRSIINKPFTIDRQQAAMLYGTLGDTTSSSFNYWTGVGKGAGRGGFADDDNNPLYFARLQWNIFGKELGFKASDLKISETPVASVAYAWSSNQSKYNKFGSSGGGVLSGYSVGEPGQYKIDQFNVDGALMYKGFSGQAEYHEKEVRDQLGQYPVTKLRGYYVQGGYLLNTVFSWWPEPLEIATRYAELTPDVNESARQKEFAVALNWFFKGHKNKVTVDASRFSLSDSNQSDDTWRYSLQWNVTL